MRITLLETGKTKEGYILSGINEFKKRLARYVPFKIETIPDIKQSRNLSMKEVMEYEGRQILKRIREDQYVVLLDERGEEYTSISLAEYINSLEGKVKHLLFIIGGPYGFSEIVYDKADARIALSRLTFSHQLVRLIFLEQLYRAFTILKGEPYHHA